MSKTELYITRHGQSYGNIPAKSGERAKDVLLREDPPLTEPGIRQAQLLGERLSQVQFDSIISSPLRRAVATAYETAVRQPGGACEIELLPDMIEVGTQPGFTGVGFEMLKKDFPCVVKYDTEKYGIGSYVPEEENELQPFERAQKVAQHILTRFPFDSDKKVLLVAHGTFNHRLICGVLGMGVTRSFNFCQENTGLTKIHWFKDGYVRLVCMDDLSHFYKDYPETILNL